MLITIKIHTQISCRGCSYFPSNTVPLKITFSTIDKLPNTSEANGRQREEQHDNQIMPMPTGEVAAAGPPSLSSSGLRVIFKVGDDLRQDQLTIQMIRVMDKLWLKENLDLKMVTFACVPTGDRQGMLEMITEAKTLREIQVSHSVMHSGASLTKLSLLLPGHWQQGRSHRELPRYVDLRLARGPQPQSTRVWPRRHELHT